MRRGFRPLHWAVLSEPAVLAQVINAAPDINARTVNGQTPLHIAAGVGAAPGIVEMLLAAGAEPNTIDNEDMSPLLQAIVAVDTRAETVNTLIAGGADVNLAIPDQHPALHKVMYTSVDLDVFEALLQAGADVNAPSRWGEPPLILAARTKGSSDLFRLLLAYGADPDLTDPDGRTALHVAIQTERDLGTLRQLIDVTDLTMGDEDGDTALHVAISHPDRISVLQALLSAGADPNLPNRHGHYPIMRAAGLNAGHRGTEMMALFLDAGADPNVGANTSRAPLHAVLDHQREDAGVDLITWLIKATDPDMRDNDANTAMHLAILKRHDLTIVEMILAAGADPNMPNGRGQLPLELALSSGQRDLVPILIDAGARVEDYAGDQPKLRGAVELAQPDLIEALLAKGLDPLERADFGETYLHQTAALYFSMSDIDVIGRIASLFVAAGVPVNATDEYGRTAAHWAVDAGAARAYWDALVAGGVDLRMKDDRGRTPLDLALEVHEDTDWDVFSLLLGEEDLAALHPRHQQILLVAAARGGDAEAVARLLALDVSPDALVQYSNQQMAPLHAALDHPDVASLLLDAGADPDLVGLDLAPALHQAVAAEFADVAMIDLLLSGGADVNRIYRRKSALDLTTDPDLTARLVAAGAKTAFALQHPGSQLARGRIIASEHAYRGRTGGGDLALSDHLMLISEPRFENRADLEPDYPGRGFVVDLETGEIVSVLENPDVTVRRGFGLATALSGGRALISAERSRVKDSVPGIVHQYDLATGALQRTFSDPEGDWPYFGDAVALEGDIVVIGAPGPFHEADLTEAGRGRVFVFDAATGELRLTLALPKLHEDVSLSFGSQVAIDDGRIFVQASNAGTLPKAVDRIYVFDARTGRRLSVLYNPDRDNLSGFGHEMAIDGDQLLASVQWGNLRTRIDGGAVLFDIKTADVVRHFRNPDRDVFHRDFGQTVALDGELVLIGLQHPFPDEEMSPAVAGVFDRMSGQLVDVIANVGDANDGVIGNAVVMNDRYIAMTKSHGWPEAAPDAAPEIAVIFDRMSDDATDHCKRADDVDTCWRAAVGLESTDLPAALAAYDRSCAAAYQMAGCYAAGKIYLLNRSLRDYPRAYDRFDRTCREGDASIGPYACKYQGWMAERGIGTHKDVTRAHDLFLRACFLHNPQLTDGEGCLYLGQSYLAGRDIVTVPNWLAYLSFVRGCLDRIDDACLAAQRTEPAIVQSGDYDWYFAQCASLLRAENSAIETCEDITDPSKQETLGHEARQAIKALTVAVFDEFQI